MNDGSSLVAARVEREALKVGGPDAITYLQGQLSQDVAGLALGRSAWSFLLQPQGKVDAWVRVTRTGDDEVVLDVETGFGEAVMSRLERFKLRTKFAIETLDWACVAVRGAGAESLEPSQGATIVAAAGWPGTEGVDLLGPESALTVPPLADPVESEAFEALRIMSGVPRMGAELTETTIPAEMGQWVIDASVSFTKGCYTGQELVARIDSRGGNVPRRIVGLVVEGDADAVPEPGAVVRLDNTDAGTVTSAAWSARRGQPVALALVKRAVDVPASGVISRGERSHPVLLMPTPM